MNDLLDSWQLKLFVDLADRCNMQRTAKALNLTPSALSHSMKRLEEDLGCKLFERKGRGLMLSANGKLFHNEAKLLVERIRNTRLRFSNQLDWRRGRLRIGSTSAGCNHILTGVLREFRDSFPEVSLRIIEASQDDLVEAVKMHELDFALCGTSRDYTDLQTLPLSTEEYVFLVNPMHPWARSGRIRREEIASQRFILPEVNSEDYGIIDHYFRTERIAITPFIEVRTEDLIKKLVGLDIGVGILPTWLVADDVKEGRLCAFPTGPRSLHRRWEILHARNHQLNLAETLFTGLAQMVARHLMESARKNRN
jgi:DNA-binding transcriptional LysR family regulator